MNALSPAPILARILADIAHDWTVRQATNDLTVTQQDAVILAHALRELASAARQMSETFQRIVTERNELLAITRNAGIIANAGTPAPAVTGNVIDLSEFFAHEQACQRRPGTDGDAA